MAESIQSNIDSRSAAVDFDDFRMRSFGPLHPNVITGSVAPATAREIMRRAVQETVPECLYAFGHGSALSSRFAPFSDLDVVVVLREGQFWEKRCLNFEGYLVELQVYTLDILEPLILLAKQSGMSFGLIAGDGEVIIDGDGGAEALRRRLKAAFEEGPAAPSTKSLDGYRHKLTNRIVELVGASTGPEQLACALSLFDLLMRIMMALDCGWRHSGKWIPRMLDKNNPAAFAELSLAYGASCAGDAVPLARFALRLLDRIGGPHWAGYTMHQPLRMDMLPAAVLVSAAQQMRG